MSMYLEYAKVSPETLKKILADDSILDAIFFGEGALPDGYNSGTDGIGLDYRMYAEIAEAMAGGTEIYDQDTWTAKAAGNQFGTELEFEFNYGPVIYFTPEEVKQIAEGLPGEGWDPDEDYEENVARFFRVAAAEGKAVLVGVN